MDFECVSYSKEKPFDPLFGLKPPLVRSNIFASRLDIKSFFLTESTASNPNECLNKQKVLVAFLRRVQFQRNGVLDRRYFVVALRENGRKSNFRA